MGLTPVSQNFTQMEDQPPDVGQPYLRSEHINQSLVLLQLFSSLSELISRVNIWTKLQKRVSLHRRISFSVAESKNREICPAALTKKIRQSARARLCARRCPTLFAPQMEILFNGGSLIFDEWKRSCVLCIKRKSSSKFVVVYPRRRCLRRKGLNSAFQ